MAKKSSNKPAPVKKATQASVKSAKPSVKAKPSKASKVVATKPAPAVKSKGKPAPVAKATPAPVKPAAPSKPQLVQGSILKHGLAAHQKAGKQNGFLH